jgi:hypothetical protein
VDLAGWVRSQPGGESNRELRGDGVHFTVDGSDRLGEWMVPQILDAVALPAATTATTARTAPSGFPNQEG